MPRVMLCVIATSVALWIFKSSSAMRDASSRAVTYFAIIFLIFSNIAFAVFGVNIEQYEIVSSSAELLLILIASASFAYAIRLVLEEEAPSKTAGAVIVGLGVALVVLPVISANQYAKNLRVGKGSQPVVYGSDKKQVGVPIGLVAGKFVIYDCRNPGSVALTDMSLDMSVKYLHSPCRAE